MAHPLLTAKNKTAETINPNVSPASTVNPVQVTGKPTPGTREWAMKCVELAKQTPQPAKAGEPAFEAFMDMLQIG